MGTCATCEEFQGEEMGIEEVEWYRWWKWTWKVGSRWRRWRHDRADHYWEWKDKLRMVWAYRMYYWARDKWYDYKERNGTWFDRLVEFHCETCDDFYYLQPEATKCNKGHEGIKRKKSTVKDMARLTTRLDEEKQNGN